MNPQDQSLAIQRIAKQIPHSDRQAVSTWLEKLLNVSKLQISSIEKVKRALALTKENKVVMPIVKIMTAELKRVGWDDRGWVARLGLSGILAGMLLFGGQGAGIAAFGTAIGVPLWVVLGGGAALAGALLEEIKPKPGAPS